MSRVFFAVRSSNSLTLLIVGVTSLRTYVLVAQPRVSGRMQATSAAIAENRFIESAPSRRSAWSAAGLLRCSSARRLPIARRQCKISFIVFNYLRATGGAWSPLHLPQQIILTRGVEFLPTG